MRAWRQRRDAADPLALQALLVCAGVSTLALLCCSQEGANIKIAGLSMAIKFLAYLMGLCSHGGSIAPTLPLCAMAMTSFGVLTQASVLVWVMSRCTAGRCESALLWHLLTVHV